MGNLIAAYCHAGCSFLRLKQPKSKVSLPEKRPPRKRAKDELDKQVKLVLGKTTESQVVQVELTDKPESSSDKSLPTKESLATESPSKSKLAPLSVDEQGKTPEKEAMSVSDAPDLVELVNKILSVSENIAKVMQNLQAASGSSFSRQTSLGTPVSLESFDAYMKIMKPIQFGKSSYEISILHTIMCVLFLFWYFQIPTRLLRRLKKEL